MCRRQRRRPGDVAASAPEPLARLGLGQSILTAEVIPVILLVVVRGKPIVGTTVT